MLCYFEWESASAPSLTFRGWELGRSKGLKAGLPGLFLSSSLLSLCERSLGRFLPPLGLPLPRFKGVSGSHSSLCRLTEMASSSLSALSSLLRVAGF